MRVIRVNLEGNSDFKERVKNILNQDCLSSVSFAKTFEDADLMIVDKLPAEPLKLSKPYIVVWEIHRLEEIEQILKEPKSVTISETVRNLRGIFTLKEIEKLRKEEFIQCLKDTIKDLEKAVEISRKVNEIKEREEFLKVGEMVKLPSDYLKSVTSTRFSALFFDKPMLKLLRTLTSMIYQMRGDLERISELTKNRGFNKLYDEKKGLFNLNEIKALWNDAQKYTIQIEPILLLGETGAGKTLIARWIRELCKNMLVGNFKEINASGLSLEIMESELFGYVKGAFTGADRDKPGLAMISIGGVLFLDEIGDIPMELQPRIMKFIEEFTFQPKGWSNEFDVYCPCLIILATNKNLEEEVNKGRFRRDFYGRLRNRLRVPSLRERINSINAIVDTILQSNLEAHKLGIKGISYECIEKLRKRDYSENFRELERLLKGAVERAHYYGVDLIVSDFIDEV